MNYHSNELGVTNWVFLKPSLSTKIGAYSNVASNQNKVDNNKVYMILIAVCIPKLNQIQVLVWL
jgi:hypothetical protein